MPQIISIQYLRAVAVLMVVGFHTIPYTFPSRVIGAAGADVFFIISGFIIWVMTASRETAPGAFLRRRVIRVVPLYWGFTLLLAAAGAAIPAAFSRLPVTPGHLLLSLAFIPHLKPFSGEVLPLLEDGWTLNYEIMFYVVVGLALLLPARLRLAGIASVLVALPLLGTLIPNKNLLATAYTDPLLLEFLGGVGIGVLWTRKLLVDVRPAWGCGLVALSIAGFVWAALAGAEAEHIRVLAWGFPGFLLVLGMLLLETQMRTMTLAWWALVGDASYSIYLSHGFVISIIRKVTDLFDPSLKSSWFVWIAIASLSIVAGIAVYRLIELPLLEALRARRFRQAAA
jgi:exopolysaccharide production protein ExoZ